VPAWSSTGQEGIAQSDPVAVGDKQNYHEGNLEKQYRFISGSEAFCDSKVQSSLDENAVPIYMRLLYTVQGQKKCAYVLDEVYSDKAIRLLQKVYPKIKVFTLSESQLKQLIKQRNADIIN
jgi:hypothetical protein